MGGAKKSLGGFGDIGKSFGKVGNSIGGALGGGGIMGNVGSAVGGVVGIDGLKRMNSGLDDFLTKTASKVGLGQNKPDEYRPEEDAFQNERLATERDRLAAELEAVKNRSATGNTVTYTGATYTPGQTAQLSPAAQMQAAQISQEQQDIWRRQQLTLAQQLTDQGNGIGPSLAQDQLQAGRDANVQMAMALGASQRGYTPGQGLRQIADQTTDANQFAAQEAARLRLTEQLAARQQLNAMLTSGRDQDIGIAASNAQFNQDANIQNQDALNKFAMTQADYDQQSNIANAFSQNYVSQYNAGNQLGAQQGNQLAGINQATLDDAMVKYYNSMILGQDYNQQQADQELERLRAGIIADINANKSSTFEAGQKRIGGYIEKAGQAVGSVFTGGASSAAGALGG